MNNVKKIKPTGLFTNYIYKAIPLAFDESMSYYETLCGLLSYLKETVIPTVNNNADAMIELQNLYVQLKNYVDNYFTNLDVQDEINNKLDEMTQSGELQEIIEKYINMNAIIGFNTINDMKQASNLINGSFAKTLGNLNLNDGGHGLYKIRNITNSDIVDNTFIVALNNPNLIAELIIEDEITPQLFGAVGDGITDDTIPLQNAINSGKIVKLISNYAYTHLIFNYNSYKINGNNHALIYIGDGTQNESILFQGHHSYIDNLRLYNKTNKTIPCMRYRSIDKLHYSQFNYFSHLQITNFELAIFYGISESESINVPQSENYINDLKTRGTHRVLYNNQPNGHLFITNSILMASSNEQTYEYDRSSSRIAKSISGALHIYDSVLLNAADGNGVGFEGKGFDIQSCNYEIAGTNFLVNGVCNINNLNGGYKGNSEKPFMELMPDEDNTSYLVRIINVEMSTPSNTANVPFIKNNNSNAFVIIDNCKINGNVYNINQPLSNAFGSIKNVYRNNKYHNFINYDINVNNYSNYLTIEQGEVSINNDEITITGVNGIRAIIQGNYNEIFEMISDIQSISGNAKFQGTVTKANSSTSQIIKDFNINNITGLYSLQNGGYKFRILIYATSANSVVKFKKIQVRGNNLQIPNLLT